MVPALALPSAQINLVLLLEHALQGKFITMVLVLHVNTNLHSSEYKIIFKKIQNYSCAKVVSFSFGVCCVFVYESSGGTISQNCSYIRNPNYPSAYSDTSAVNFIIQKCDSSKNYD